MIVAQVRAVAARHRRRRGQDRDARDGRDDRRRRARARRARSRHADRARPGDGRPSRAPSCSTQEARAALVERLLPRVTVVDAEPAGGARDRRARRERATRPELARAIHALGPRCVVVTGGHREQAVDVFFDGETLVEIPGERYPDGAAHGSGCTHSSVLAAHLAHGFTPLEAARAAKARAARGGARRAARDRAGRRSGRRARHPRAPPRRDALPRATALGAAHNPLP